MSTPSWVKPAAPPNNKARNPNRSRERAEKDRAAQFRDRFRDGRRVVGAFVSRLLVATVDQDREIDPEADQDRAHADRDHVQLVGKSAAPTASATRQQSRSEKPMPNNGNQRRNPMKNTAPTSRIEPSSVTTISCRMLSEISAT